MKKKLAFALFILLLSICSFAQISRFFKSYGIWANAYGSIVQQTQDNGFITSGIYFDTVTSGVDTLLIEVVSLIKTDFTGTAQWIKTYNVGGQCAYGSGMTKTSDGGYAVATVYTDSTGVNPEIYLFKTDLNGNVIWSQVYGGFGNEYAIYLIQTLDAGYAIACYSDSHAAGYGDYYLIKTDSNGNMQWAKVYDKLSGYEWPASLQQTSDGGYVMIGLRAFTDTINWTYQYNNPFLVKLDNQGNLLWAKEYVDPSDDSYPTCIRQTSDGGYIISGYSYDTLNYFSKAYLIKTDGAGNVEWSKDYSANSNSYSDGAYFVQQCDDGGYVVSVTFGDTINYYLGGLMKIDPMGSIQWAKIYDKTTPVFPGAIEKVNDGGYAMTGYLFSAYEAFILKTDSLGSLGCNDTNIVITVTNHPHSISTGAKQDTIGTQNFFPMSFSNIADSTTVFCENNTPPPPPPSSTSPCNNADSISMPNVFSPNNDGINDLYSVVGIAECEFYSMHIFNRWGNLIFATDRISFSWDGRTPSGTNAEAGVYYCILTTKREIRKGFITLIR